MVFISLRLGPKTRADYENLLQMIMLLARRPGTAEPTGAGAMRAGGIFVRRVFKKEKKKPKHINFAPGYV